MPTGPPTLLARIFLLGRFEVEVGGKSVPTAAWSKRRAVDVLTALALAPGRTLHREELIDRFWPDKDLDAGANNLHRALYQVRRAAGVHLVRAPPHRMLRGTPGRPGRRAVAPRRSARGGPAGPAGLAPAPSRAPGDFPPASPRAHLGPATSGPLAPDPPLSTGPSIAVLPFENM